MFKFKKITISGLPGFDGDMELDANRHLTTLIGPNGSGKSTSLSAITSVISFLNTYSFDKKGNTFAHWLNWSQVEISFESEVEIENEFEQLEKLGKKIKSISFRVENKKDLLFVSKIWSENGKYELNSLEDYYLESKEFEKLKTNLKNILDLKNTSLKNLEILKARPNNSASIQAEQKRLDDFNARIKELEAAIQVESIELLDFSPSPLERKVISDFIGELDLPLVKFISFGETDFSDIKTTIKKISEIRGGNHPDEYYNKIKNQIRDLIQQEPHFYNERSKNQDFLNLNGVDYQNVSTGTKICLFYFSLIYETYENDIIIWDEPENGLHPTRRYKLLELILKDTRQFIIATHSTELAPIFDNRCSVIRTSIDIDHTLNKQIIKFQKMSDKRDAYALADQLGLSPSKLLFTANVAIWVEGPSDMIFWRKMISIHPEGSNLIEGFDYTFVLYGGKCISHLTALETNEKMDILSLSSHPIFIVDSDISELEQYENIEQNLKTEAKRILNVFNDDQRESGSSLFLYSFGREMENYFPLEAIKYSILNVSKQITSEELNQIAFQNDDWGRNEKYFTMIDRKFTAGNLGTIKEGKFISKGISRWGENNKTEMVKFALEWPEISLIRMKYNCQTQVEQIVSFIKRWQF